MRELTDGLMSIRLSLLNGSRSISSAGDTENREELGDERICRA